jgi:hypothetical protein
MREKLFWQKGPRFRGNVLDLVYIKLIYYKLLSKCKFEDTYTTNVIGCDHSINDNNVLRRRLLLFELYQGRRKLVQISKIWSLQIVGNGIFRVGCPLKLSFSPFKFCHYINYDLQAINILLYRLRLR